MTKHGRSMNFLEDNPADRIPVALFHHFCPPGEWGKGMKDQEAFERDIIGYKLVGEEFDPNVAKIMNDTLMIMPVDVSLVKISDDLRKVQTPASDSASAMKSLELTRRVRTFYKDSGTPICATGLSPSVMLHNNLCIEGIPGKGDGSRMLKFIDEAPDAVAVAMKNLCNGISAINGMPIGEGGVGGIYTSVGSQSNFFNGGFYRTCMMSYEKEVMKSTNKLSKINLLHICDYRGHANHLDLFTDFEAAVINIAVYVEGVSLSGGKKLFGGKPVFGSSAQDAIIYKGTEREAKEAAWKILDECGQVGIMLGADYTIPNDIDDSRLEWVRQAAIEYAAR